MFKKIGNLDDPTDPNPVGRKYIVLKDSNYSTKKGGGGGITRRQVNEKCKSLTTCVSNIIPSF